VIVTVKDWAERHLTPYRVIIPERMGQVYQPRSTMGRCEPVPVPQPECYVAEIPNATIRGIDESVWADGECMNDLAMRHLGRAPLSGSTVAANAPLDGPSTGSSYRTSDRTVIPLGVLLTHHFAGNWFHWLVEQVSRLQLLDVDAPLLVDRRLPPQCLAALAAVTGRQQIAVDPTYYTVKRLIVLGRLVWLPPDLLAGERVIASDILMASEAITYLRRLATLRKPDTKLYIERTGPARLLNKGEVRAHYEAQGYVTIHPEESSFDQQRTLFGRASAIAGESGGGMTNVLFAPPECEVTIFQTPIEWNLYANLVGFAGQPARFVDGVPTPGWSGPYYQSSYTVPL
jgi:hypothetical protein